MISIKILFLILIVHWIADFILQTDWQAKNKSTNNKALLWHTVTYSIFWILPIKFCGLTLEEALAFACMTFIFHTITDFFTSRLNSYLYKQNKIHWFFVSIGFDQILHYIQLIITFKLLE